MTISADDKAKFARQVESLREAEEHEPGSPEARRRFRATANALRAKRGLPPLRDEEEDPPELDFYRRAKALGMVRPGNGEA